MKEPGKNILRATLSLDGKLLGAAGRPLQKNLSDLPVNAVDELHLKIQPVVSGGDALPAAPLSVGGFLRHDIRFQLLSVTRAGEALALRYRRSP